MGSLVSRVAHVWRKEEANAETANAGCKKPGEELAARAGAGGAAAGAGGAEADCRHQEGGKAGRQEDDGDACQVACAAAEAEGADGGGVCTDGRGEQQDSDATSQMAPAPSSAVGSSTRTAL